MVAKGISIVPYDWNNNVADHRGRVGVEEIFRVRIGRVASFDLIRGGCSCSSSSVGRRITTTF